MESLGSRLYLDVRFTLVVPCEVRVRPACHLTRCYYLHIYKSILFGSSLGKYKEPLFGRFVTNFCTRFQVGPDFILSIMNVLPRCDSFARVLLTKSLPHL